MKHEMTLIFINAHHLLCSFTRKTEHHELNTIQVLGNRFFILFKWFILQFFHQNVLIGIFFLPELIQPGSLLRWIDLDWMKRMFCIQWHHHQMSMIQENWAGEWNVIKSWNEKRRFLYFRKMSASEWCQLNVIAYLIRCQYSCCYNRIFFITLIVFRLLIRMLHNI